MHAPTGSAHRRRPGVALLLALAALPACSIDDAMQASDKDLFLVGRAQLPIGEGKADEDHATVEFSGSWFGGDARVGDPAGAELHYSTREMSAAVRYTLQRGGLGFGVLAGLQTDAMTLETRPTASAPSDRDQEIWIGPVLGVEADWSAGSRIRLYGRITGAAMLPSANSVSFEGGVGVRVVDELELLLGYRHWNLRGDTDTLLPGFSAIDLDVDGAFVGGELRF